MQVLNDIWSSVKGNAKTRINDPIIGAFVISWALFNWDKLALLFFGDKSLELRINKISNNMATIENPSLLWQDLNLVILPVTLSIFYLFLLPHIALWVERKLKPTAIDRHDHTVEIDINKAIKQKELNKARLRANPDNDFLTQEVKIDIEREQSEVDLKHAEAEIARSKQIEAKAKATAAEIELEKRQYQEEMEKRALAVSKSRQEAALAAHRFPSAYLFIQLLSDSTKDEDVILSLDALTRCIASVFGYKSFNELLSDERFSNAKLETMEYVLLDSDGLMIEFTEILESEGIEDYDSDWLIGHLEMIFDNLPYELIYADTLAQKIYEEIEIDRFSLLQHDGVSGGMAETDTIFDEVDEIILDKYEYNTKDNTFIVTLSGSASGYHRSDADMGGQGINLFIKATCSALIGRFGLSNYEVSANARPIHYD